MWSSPGSHAQGIEECDWPGLGHLPVTEPGSRLQPVPTAPKHPKEGVGSSSSKLGKEVLV